MIKYNRQDALLTATVTVPASASQTVTSPAIDAAMPGGIDECQLVIELPAIGSAGTVTLTVLSCASLDGQFTPTGAEFTASNEDRAIEFRSRMPLDAHRYLKLRAATSATAPANTIEAKLTLRV